MFLPLQKAHEQDVSRVGVKAKTLALLEQDIHVPFSLVIASEVYNSFLNFNNLESKLAALFADINSQEVLIQQFSKTASLFEQASFPPDVVAELRECFELACLDTSNLHAQNAGTAILVLKRSTDYDDTDVACPGVVYTKESFVDFVKAVKSCFLSAFSPTSVLLRKKDNISSFQTSVIVSRMPSLQTCLESNIVANKNTIVVKSYVGFPDKSGIVPKDSFRLTIDFLRIVDAQVLEQTIVAVFDNVANQVQHRTYAPGGSAQTVPDQVILEVGRLTKKISAITKQQTLQAEFIANKQNELVCLDVSLRKETKEEQIKTTSSNEQQKEEAISVQTKEELLSLTEKIQGEAELAQALRSFLAKHKFSKYGPALQVVNRSLENEINPQTLKQALRMTIEVIDEFD